MAQTQMSQSPPKIDGIYALIRQVRRKLRSSRAVIGLGVTLGLLLGALAVTTLADIALTLWPFFRFLGLLLVVIPAALALTVGVVRPIFRRLGPRRVARMIEHHLPGIHNRLVSCVDLDGKQDKGSTPFYRRLLQEAVQRVQGFDPSSVVDKDARRRAVTFAVSATMALVLCWVVFVERMPTAMARIFAPFADIPPYTGVEFAVKPGDALVLRGDDVKFEVTVTKGDPEQLKLEILPTDGTETLWYNLDELRDKSWLFTLRGYQQSFSYRVHGGGTWTTRHRVGILERPEIEDVSVAVQLPDYMRVEELLPNPAGMLDVSGPEKSSVHVLVAAAGDVSEGEVQLLAPKRVQVENIGGAVRRWFGHNPPEGAQIEGVWERQSPTPEETIAHTDPHTDSLHEHGFRNSRAPFAVRGNETLYARIYIPSDRVPKTVMLQWRDTEQTEYRAFWGEDLIERGEKGSPSRLHMGPIPEPGKWATLEVDAEKLALKGSLRGMLFSAYGGQCYWSEAGAKPARHTTEIAYVPTGEVFPLAQSAPNEWTGAFSLDKSCWYRVELRNEGGHANKPMQEARLTAYPDVPPQVQLRRPTGDVTVSHPCKVPLVVAVQDDFCLDSVSLVVPKEQGDGFTSQPLKTYTELAAVDTVLTEIDLEALGLKVGDTYRYRLSVRDRKGQGDETKEYSIRIEQGDQAVDQRIERTVQRDRRIDENLTRLIAEQAKIQTLAKAVTEAYQQAADDAKEQLAKAREESTDSQRRNDDRPDLSKVDADTRQELDQMRRRLSELAKLQKKNADQAQGVKWELEQSAKEAQEIGVLPPEITRQSELLAESFEQGAARPMKRLAEEQKEGSRSDKPIADPKRLQREGDEIQRNLKTIQKQLQALSEAKANVMSNAEAAVAELNRAMLQQQAERAQDEVDGAQEFMRALQRQLGRLENEQSELQQKTQEASREQLPQRQAEQEQFEQRAERPLAEARHLIGDEQMQQLLAQQGEMSEPGDAQQQGTKQDAPQGKEANSAKQTTEKTSVGKDQPSREKGDDASNQPEAQTNQPNSSQGEQSANDEQMRQQLGQRQQDQRQELAAAQTGLAQRRQALQDLMQKLNEALGDASPQQSNELSNVLESAQLRQAMDLASKAAQLQDGMLPSETVVSPTADAQSGIAVGNLEGSLPVGLLTEAELGQLDLETQAIILKLQPRIREELLQGMREEGPQGYRKLIRDYFQRLTKAQAKTK